MNIFGRRLSATSLLAAGMLAVSCGIGANSIDTARSRLDRLDDVFSQAVVYDDAGDPAKLKGQIVIATGTVSPAEEMKDPAFNLTMPALKFMRESQIFQWVQTGGKVKTYAKDWKSEPVDSYLFDGMHRNTGSISYPTQITSAEEIELVRSGRGIARLDPAFAQLIGGQRKMMLSWEQYKDMPADVRLRFDLVDGSLVEKTAAAGDPRIGDNRTRFMFVPPYEATVVGMLAGGRIMTVDREMRTVGILKPGRLAPDELRDVIAEEIVRDEVPFGIFAVLLWLAGFLLLLNDYRHAPRVVAPVRPLRLGR